MTNDSGKRRTLAIRRAFLMACVMLAALCVLVVCASCTDSRAVAFRGVITTSDGVVLARSTGDGKSDVEREYPQKTMAAQLVGSVYAQEAGGIEGQYAGDLESGTSVKLTIDSAVQQACERALAGKTGAAVVMDPETGAVLAMASTPTDDLNDPQDEENALVNRAIELRSPGSTFKTITLVKSLEEGVTTLDDLVSAPSSIMLEGGSVSNNDTVQYGTVSVREAYAKSLNTAFAELSLKLGTETLDEAAEAFGFGSEQAQDLNAPVPEIAHANDMTMLECAWYGAGQSLVREDGTAAGPLTSALHMTAITSCFENGGRLLVPYVVESVRGADNVDKATSTVVANEDFLSQAIIDDVVEAMHLVVKEGTGRSAAVSGIDVYGKAGTAETSSDAADGWFAGIAEAPDGRAIALTVVIEDADKATDAPDMAAQIIKAVLK